jgi:hypothetical protein
MNYVRTQPAAKDDVWVVTTSEGAEVSLRTVTDEALGVVDWHMVMPGGIESVARSRVVPRGEGSEVFGLPSETAAVLCDTSPAAYRKRLSRVRGAVRAFVAEHCGIVNPNAVCRCHRRSETGAISGARTLLDPEP